MKIGILGGGFFWNHWNENFKEIKLETPYGAPADAICYGQLNGHDVFTLQRHGKSHHLAPHQVPVRENLYALSLCQIDFLIHVAACGALTDRFKVGDIVLFDQLLDFTKSRPNTFGPPVIDKVTHLSSAEPVSIELIDMAANILTKHSIDYVKCATLVTEEGPRFGTNAEIKMFKMLGAELINHSSSPEVFLAQELGIPVLAMVLVTNIVQDHETKDDSKTYGTISSSIHTLKDRIPDSIKIIISNIHDKFITRSKVKKFDINSLDIRSNQET